MAVTHNSVNSGTTIALSVSFNVTVAAGSNFAALIGIAWIENSAGVGDSFVDLVTFAGQTATFVQMVSTPSGTSEQYYVTGFTAGVKNCQVIWNSSFTVLGIVGCEVFNNVSQTTPIGQKNTASGVGLTTTVDVTGTTSGSQVVDDVGVDETTGTTLVVGASQTSRWNTRITAGTDGFRGAGSNEPSSGGTITMSWTRAVSKNWATAACEVLEFVAPPPVTVSLGGYTSYDLGLFDAGSPENPVPPEVAARIARGDKRFMPQGG